MAAIFRNPPFALEPFVRLFFQMFVLILASLISLSCATQQQTLPKLDLEVDAPVELPKLSASSPFIARPDSSYWDDLTVHPDQDFDSFLVGGMCGLVYTEPVALGQWNLVGVSSNSVYTPVLDIFSDKTGRSTNNDTTYYYHFQLSSMDN